MKRKYPKVIISEEGENGLIKVRCGCIEIMLLILMKQLKMERW